MPLPVDTDKPSQPQSGLLSLSTSRHLRRFRNTLGVILLNPKRHVQILRQDVTRPCGR
jgi:hypothetical protein